MSVRDHLAIYRRIISRQHVPVVFATVVVLCVGACTKRSDTDLVAEYSAELAVNGDTSPVVTRALQRGEYLVEAHEHGSVGRRIDRSYVRTATSYAIAPKTLGGVAVDPHTVADAFSAAYLSAVAGRALNDLAALGRAAAARGKRVPTLTLESDVRFATPADQRGFADELTTALATLAAKYHHPDAPQGRTFRVFACSYPAVPSPPAKPEGGREADMEAT